MNKNIFKNKKTNFTQKSIIRRHKQIKKLLHSFKPQLEEISKMYNMNIHVVNINFIKRLRNDFKGGRNTESRILKHMKYHGVI